MTLRPRIGHTQTGDPASRARSPIQPLIESVGTELSNLLSKPLAPGLYLVATPIGHLGDITLRALAVLATADVVCCEDTRHTLKLLNRYGIARPLRTYHEHNAEAERPRLLRDLADGRSVGLVSDAGTPLISDPGYKLVRAALDAGHAVWSVPGPSAVLAALGTAGLASDTFLFGGFLPAKQAARRSRIAELAQVSATLVFFESPERVASALADLAEQLGPRPAALVRELTKLHEEVRRAPLPELARTVATTPVKGECVIVIGPPAAAAEASEPDVRAALSEALGRSSMRDAVREVTDRFGWPRKRVYDLAIAIRPDRHDEP
jgi:16S rRNA (cytidine1402-2'-O)-methyltransferase